MRMTEMNESLAINKIWLNTTSHITYVCYHVIIPQKHMMSWQQLKKKVYKGVFIPQSGFFYLTFEQLRRGYYMGWLYCI